MDLTGEGRPAWEQRLAAGGSGLVPNLLRKHGLPQRLAEALCLEAGLPLDRWEAWWLAVHVSVFIMGGRYGNQ